MRRRLLAALAALAASGEAAAHGTSKGLGDFWGGAVHPLVEPAHLIAIVAFALFIGGRGAGKTTQATLCFALGSVIGLASAALGWLPDTDGVVLGLAALVGIGVAAAVDLHRVVYGAVGLALGAGIGVASFPEDRAGGALVSSTLGTVFGINCWMYVITVVVGELRRPWMLILVRVIGSWATASSVLVLALWVAQSHAHPAATEVPLDTRR